MSMIGNLRALSQADVDRLLADPSRIEGFLYDEDDGGTEGFGPYEDLELDKAWHGIHYLLTGTTWEGELPTSFLVQGGQEVGDVDVGYGPARALTSTEVAQLAEALRPLSGAKLAGRFDGPDMMDKEIYPTIWDRPAEEDDTVGYLTSYFDEMREFVLAAAGQGRGLLIWLN